MGFYRRRHPERSDYYRLLESGFEAFARNWPEDFESRYGFLRKEVQGAVFAFLECGIPENGVARVRCPGCGHDFFVAFSCRTRVVCPSCTTRRSLLFGEKVREIVHPLNHRHLTFTIPKLLRAYLRRNRRLGKLLLRSAWQAWQEYLRKRLQISAGMSGGIFCLQTHGSLFNFHPHVHALVLPGLVRQGRFHELKGCSATAVAVSFRSRFLNALQKQEVLDGDMVERLMSWDHNSGFNVHAGKPINGADGEAIERQARYMSRAPLSIERIHYHADDHSVTVDGGKSHAGSRNWSVPEFFALLATHTPCRYESLVTYYGVYSSSHRGKCMRENHEERVEETVVEVSTEIESLHTETASRGFQPNAE